MATLAVLQVAVLGGFPSGRTPGIEEIGLHYGVREDLSRCAQQCQQRAFPVKLTPDRRTFRMARDPAGASQGTSRLPTSREFKRASFCGWLVFRRERDGFPDEPSDSWARAHRRSRGGK